jgi:thiol-disulfide isomerase/thioredoxin
MNFKTKRSILILTTFVMIALLMYCIGCKAAAGSQVGDKATDFNLSTLTGEKMHLRDLEGKPVMFTFWTTGCSACIYQMPFLQAARDELDNKVTFIEIDIAQSGDTVKQCLAYYGFNVSVALDSDAATAIAYNIRYTPTNVIIDSRGVIQQIKIGAFRNTTAVLSALSDIK